MPIHRLLAGPLIAVLVIVLAVALVAAQDTEPGSSDSQQWETMTEDTTEVAPEPSEGEPEMTEPAPPAEEEPGVTEELPFDTAPVPTDVTPVPTATSTPTPQPVAAPSLVDLRIVDFNFDPAETFVAAGGTVRWTNTGQSPHTATSTTLLFQSGAIAPGTQFSVLLAAPGDYPFFCEIHPTMTGVIHVVPAVPTTPTPAAATATPGQANPPSSSAPSSPSSGSEGGSGPSQPPAGPADTNPTAVPSTSPTRSATPTPTHTPEVTNTPVRSATIAGPMSASVDITDDGTANGNQCSGCRYSPSSVQVVRGGTVTWTNRGKLEHTATSAQGIFDTTDLNPGQSRTITFSNPGTYQYKCSFHSNMNGTVVVL
jgi:plastocyanin